MAKEASSVPTIPARWLAKMLGVEVQELINVPKSFIGRPDKQDNYPQTKAVEGGFAYMRQQRDLMNAREIAEMLNVSAARVSVMAKEGTFKIRTDSMYDRRETIRAVVQWFRERMGNSASDIGALKRLKLEQEIAISKNTLAIQDKTYMRVEDLKKPLEHRILLARQKFLRLGNKIAPRIPFLKSEAEIEKAINDEVEEALREFARPVDYDAEIGTEE